MSFFETTFTVRCACACKARSWSRGRQQQSQTEAAPAPVRGCLDRGQYRFFLTDLRGSNTRLSPDSFVPFSLSASQKNGMRMSHNWPSGLIRNGSPVWKCKRCKNIRTKWADWAANGLVWMPQALKLLCPIPFLSWEISPFPLLALWGNKKWLPSMKV